MDDLHVFLSHCNHILFTFLCLAVHSFVYQYRPSFVLRSSGTAARLPRGGYDPEEASRHMAEKQNINIKAAVYASVGLQDWVKVVCGLSSGTLSHVRLCARGARCCGCCGCACRAGLGFNACAWHVHGPAVQETSVSCSSSFGLRMSPSGRSFSWVLTTSMIWS